MSENNDFDVPRSKDYVYGEVAPPAFNEKVKIFWGPNQPTLYPNYAPAGGSVHKWRTEHLNIPRVVRFIYNGPDKYEANQWPVTDPGTGGPDDIQHRVIYVGPHDIPGLLLIGWDVFLNGNRVYNGSSTGILRFVDGFDMLPFWYVGLSFRLVYPQRLPILYGRDLGYYYSDYNGTRVEQV